MLRELVKWLERRNPPRVTIDSIKTIEPKAGQMLIVSTCEHLTQAHINVIRKSLEDWAEAKGVKVVIVDPCMKIDVAECVST